jgi:hypothetical protein
MEDGNPAPTLLHYQTRLDNDMSTDREVYSAIYLTIVGRLMYAATSTWPDIAYSVAALRRYNAKPYTTHKKAAKRVLRYLKATAGVGIVFPGSDTDVLFSYTHSDFAGDRADRKSQYGFIFYLYGRPLDWQSKKQFLVATSTTEAKYHTQGQMAYTVNSLHHRYIATATGR